MTEAATLTLKGVTYEFPVIVGTQDEAALDIRKLRSTTGTIALDEGFGNTGSCRSAITYLNGEKGILRYRGYPIEQLANSSSFIEVAYLLVHGKLPTAAELSAFNGDLDQHSLLHEHMLRLFDAFPPDAHPMAIASAVVSSLSTYYQDTHDVFDEDAVNLSAVRLIAKLPTIAAWAYRKSHGLPIMYPKNDLGYTANFLRMMFGFPTEEYVVDEEVARALDVLFILHADHEQNCSTSTVRLVGSAHANLFASIAAGICALWGPLHGGANQKVLEMLTHIRDNGGNVQKFIDMAKDKSNDFRLMGFGHRVYKNFDPRAMIIKTHAAKVLDKVGVGDPLLNIAKELEQAALADDYFKERKLYANVDFYSGIIYRAMGFPTDMFTVLFAIGRLPGWIAQWKELIQQRMRIGRPRQIYIGEKERAYTPLDAR